MKCIRHCFTVFNQGLADFLMVDPKARFDTISIAMNALDG
jgi:hypothetical protein